MSYSIPASADNNIINKVEQVQVLLSDYKVEFPLLPVQSCYDIITQTTREYYDHKANKPAVQTIAHHILNSGDNRVAEIFSSIVISGKSDLDSRKAIEMLHTASKECLLFEILKYVERMVTGLEKVVIYNGLSNSKQISRLNEINANRIIYFDPFTLIKVVIDAFPSLDGKHQLVTMFCVNSLERQTVEFQKCAYPGTVFDFDIILAAKNSKNFWETQMLPQLRSAQVTVKKPAKCGIKFLGKATKSLPVKNNSLIVSNSPILSEAPKVSKSPILASTNSARKVITAPVLTESQSPKVPVIKNAKSVVKTQLIGFEQCSTDEKIERYKLALAILDGTVEDYASTLGCNASEIALTSEELTQNKQQVYVFCNETIKLKRKVSNSSQRVKDFKNVKLVRGIEAEEQVIHANLDRLILLPDNIQVPLTLVNWGLPGLITMNYQLPDHTVSIYLKGLADNCHLLIPANLKSVKLAPELSYIESYFSSDIKVVINNDNQVLVAA